MANPVRMGEAITAWGGSITDCAQRSGMMAECVADIIQSQGMAQLGKNHGYHVAPSEKLRHLRSTPWTLASLLTRYGGIVSMTCFNIVNLCLAGFTVTLLV